jgi:hypothetical protein
MPAPFSVALDYAHAGARAAPSDRELAEAGGMIVGAERRGRTRLARLAEATRAVKVLFRINAVAFLVMFLGGVLGFADAESVKTFLLGIIAILCAALCTHAALAPARAEAEMFTPDELARLVGYVTCTAATGPALTPLGHRAKEAYEAWPRPLDSPVTVEEAAWKPLR